MADTNSGAFRIEGAIPVADVRSLIRDSFGWALELDWSAPEFQEAPELGDQTEFGNQLGELINARNLEQLLEGIDVLLRAARIDPALLPDSCAARGCPASIQRNSADRIKGR